MLDQIISSHTLSVGHFVSPVDEVFDLLDALLIKGVLSVSAIIQTVKLHNRGHGSRSSFVIIEPGRNLKDKRIVKSKWISV